MGYDLEPTQAAPLDLPIDKLGEVFWRSGFFADTKAANQAIVKILAGRERGIGPVQSMTDIYVVKGRITLSAQLMASLIKRSGRYRFKVVEHDDQKCVIKFFEGTNGGLGTVPTWEEVGTSTFTMQDAQRAGLTGSPGPWKAHPRNMLWARAMSNGARWFCPDALGGVVYTPDEAGEMEDERPIVTAEPIPLEEGVGRTPGYVLGPPPPAEGMPINETQKKRLFALVNELGWSDDERKEAAGVESFNDLTADRANELAGIWQRQVNRVRREEAQSRSSEGTDEGAPY